MRAEEIQWCMARSACHERPDGAEKPPATFYAVPPRCASGSPSACGSTLAGVDRLLLLLARPVSPSHRPLGPPPPPPPAECEPAQASHRSTQLTRKMAVRAEMTMPASSSGPLQEEGELGARVGVAQAAGNAGVGVLLRTAGPRELPLSAATRHGDAAPERQQQQPQREHPPPVVDVRRLLHRNLRVAPHKDEQAVGHDEHRQRQQHQRDDLHHVG